MTKPITTDSLFRDLQMLKNQIAPLEREMVLRSSSPIPQAKISRTTDLSFANGSTLTMTPMNVEDYDSDDMVNLATNPERITVKTAGVYIITGQVVWSTNTSGTRSAHIGRNGSSTWNDKTAWQRSGPFSAGSTIYTVTDVFQCTVGEWFSLHAYQNSGVALNCKGYLSMHYIGRY